MSVVKNLWAFFFIISVSAAQASNMDTGFNFSPERIIYLESNKKGVMAGLENATADSALIQAQIIPSNPLTGLPALDGQNGESPFLITPPLHRLNTNERFNWRIQRVSDGNLANDRETIFYIALRVIPDTSNIKFQSNAGLILTPTIYLKMLYRPKAIENINIGNQVSSLKFTQNDKKLIIKNPTPLSMTFASLQVGSYSIPIERLNHSLQPFGELQIELPASVSGEITWRVLNEYGLATKLEVYNQDK